MERIVQIELMFNNIKSNFCNVNFLVDYSTVLVGQNVLGGIALSPKFGKLPYNIQWEDGATDQDRAHLESGIL